MPQCPFLLVLWPMVLFRNGDHPLLYISWYLGTYFMRSSLYFFSLTEDNQELLKNFDTISFSIWSIFKNFPGQNSCRRTRLHQKFLKNSLGIWFVWPKCFFQHQKRMISTRNSNAAGFNYIISSIFDKCSIMHQTQSQLNQTSYRNFYFSEFVANALYENMIRQKKQPLSSETSLKMRLPFRIRMPPHLKF